MPLQMRLPKFGFSSRVNNNFKEVNIKNINGMKVVNLETLKEKKLITKSVKKVKIFGNTEVDSKITVEGISLTKGAKQAIENAGGKVVDLEKKNNKDTKDKSNSEDNE
jgi:large subunit ribosomal protein L15